MVESARAAWIISLVLAYSYNDEDFAKAIERLMLADPNSALLRTS
jgi:hypothetical protein